MSVVPVDPGTTGTIIKESADPGPHDVSDTPWPWQASRTNYNSKKVHFEYDITVPGATVGIKKQGVDIGPWENDMKLERGQKGVWNSWTYEGTRLMFWDIANQNLFDPKIRKVVEWYMLQAYIAELRRFENLVGYTGLTNIWMRTTPEVAEVTGNGTILTLPYSQIQDIDFEDLDPRITSPFYIPGEYMRVVHETTLHQFYDWVQKNMSPTTPLLPVLKPGDKPLMPIVNPNVPMNLDFPGSFNNQTVVDPNAPVSFDPNDIIDENATTIDLAQYGFNYEGLLVAAAYAAGSVALSAYTGSNKPFYFGLPTSPLVAAIASHYIHEAFFYDLRDWNTMFSSDTWVAEKLFGFTTGDKSGKQWLSTMAAVDLAAAGYSYYRGNWGLFYLAGLVTITGHPLYYWYENTFNTLNGGKTEQQKIDDRVNTMMKKMLPVMIAGGGSVATVAATVLLKQFDVPDYVLGTITEIGIAGSCLTGLIVYVTDKLKGGLPFGL